jgi:uncharacterized protein (DUF427 family)
VEATARDLQVVFDGRLIAHTQRGQRVLETNHPPVYYFPPEDVRLDSLEPSRRRSWCEWKGEARYYQVVTPNRVSPDAAWSYPEPRPGFEVIRGYFAFYPGRVEACRVDGALVRPQPGDFYGGWITEDLVGPFKGASGTEWW